jgi:hypothetical protein
MKESNMKCGESDVKESEMQEKVFESEVKGWKRKNNEKCVKVGKKWWTG